MAAKRKTLPPPAHPPGLILDALALGVFAVDLAGRITFLNQAAEEITGLPRGQALGRTCREVFKSTLCESACPLRRAMETGESQYNLEAVFIRQDGRSVLPVKVSAAPLPGPDGQVCGGVETFASLHLTKVFNLKSKRSYDWDDFVGQSEPVQRLFEVLRVVAHTNVIILIEGPTGTGKGLLAHIVHYQSPRREGQMVKVNCAALPENLLESELFGYVRGAFTGAERDKPGLFQLADKGTIFLDEISELSLSLQAKLLRVLEDQEFYPLGARKTTKVDVRILAASNKPLDKQVQAGLFRSDLFYRLNVIRIHIPPLRDRREDIPLLINRFIQRKNVERGTFICRFAPEALATLLNYDFPGNVREMENVIEHACLLCQGDVIKSTHLPQYLTTVEPPAPAPQPRLKRLRRTELLAALSAHGGNKAQTARSLGVDRTTLWRWLHREGLD